MGLEILDPATAVGVAYNNDGLGYGRAIAKAYGGGVYDRGAT